MITPKLFRLKETAKKLDIEISDSDLALLLKSKSVLTYRTPFEIKVGKVEKNSPAKKAGLEKEDIFATVDGLNFEFYDEFTDYLNSKKGENIELGLVRDGQKITKEVNVTEEGKIGFYAAYINPDIFEFKTIKYGFLESFPAGIKRGVRTTGDYLKQFRLFFKKETKAYESLGGFATIGNIFPPEPGIGIRFGI